LPEIAFESLEILVGVGKFFPRVVKNVLHVLNAIADMDGQGGTVLSAGKA
jgi:hypothetical protein